MVSKATLNTDSCMMYSSLDEPPIDPPPKYSAINEDTGKQNVESKPKMLPIIVPQSTKQAGALYNAFSCPFMRCYSPDLAYLGISEEKFLEVIDGLNEVFILHPLFQTINVAGLAVSMVPHHIAQLLGRVISSGGGIGGSALSYVRTKKYVKQLNEETFWPKGLCLRIRSTKKMLNAIGFEGGNNAFKSHFPNINNVEDAEMCSYFGRRQEIDQHEVLLDALDGRVASLTKDVPSVIKPTNWMDNMSSWQASRAEKKQVRKEAELWRKAQEKGYDVQKETRHEQRNVDKVLLKIEKYEKYRDNAKTPKKYKHAEEELVKLRSDLRKEERTRDKKVAEKMRDFRREGSKFTENTAKTAMRLRWIVIMPKASIGLDEDLVDDEELADDEKVCDEKYSVKTA